MARAEFRSQWLGVPPSVATNLSRFSFHPLTSNLTPSSSVLRDLRVCFLAGTLGQGGAERQVFYIASALKSAGAHVRGLTLTSGDVWEPRLEAIGVPVEFVGASASRLKRLITISKAVRKFRPDIVQSQHFYANGYSAIAARLCGVRAVGAVRCDGFYDMRDCGRHLGKLCLRLPHRLAANSQAAIRNLVSLGCRRENLFHLPNAVDLTKFRFPESRNGDSVTILGIGRLVPQKRFDRFLRIIALLQQKCRVPFRALIVGEGSLRPELEKLARDSGLCPGVVEFCGNVSDARSLYGKAQMLLLTSDFEGTPNVVLEAMASGLAVVATSVGDVPELVQHGVTGYMVETSDEQGAVRHLDELVRNPCLRESMGARAHAFIQSYHALETLPGHLANLYSMVLP